MRHQRQEPTLICGALRARAWVDDAEKGDGGCMKRSRKTQDGGKDKEFKQREKTNQEKYKEQGKGKNRQEEAEGRQDETRHARQADLTRRESRAKVQCQS